jgi:hypothetical protein
LLRWWDVMLNNTYVTITLQPIHILWILCLQNILWKGNFTSFHPNVLFPSHLKRLFWSLPWKVYIKICYGNFNLAHIDQFKVILYTKIEISCTKLLKNRPYSKWVITNQPSRWSKALLVKLIMGQHVKKLSVFYWNQGTISLFTTVCSPRLPTLLWNKSGSIPVDGYKFSMQM